MGFWQPLRGLWRGEGLERGFFIDNLLVQIHCIIVMIRWTGLAPREFEFPFPGGGGKVHGTRPDEGVTGGREG